MKMAVAIGIMHVGQSATIAARTLKELETRLDINWILTQTTTHQFKDLDN